MLRRPVHRILVSVTGRGGGVRAFAILRTTICRAIVVDRARAVNRGIGFPALRTASQRALPWQVLRRRLGRRGGLRVDLRGVRSTSRDRGMGEVFDRVIERLARFRTSIVFVGGLAAGRRWTDGT